MKFDRHLGDEVTERRVARAAQRLMRAPNLANWNEARRLHVKAEFAVRNAPSILEMMRAASTVNRLASAMRANQRGVAASLAALWHASTTGARLSRRPLGRRSARGHRAVRRVASSASGGGDESGSSSDPPPSSSDACSGVETLSQLALSTLALAVRAGVAGVA